MPADVARSTATSACSRTSASSDCTRRSRACRSSIAKRSCCASCKSCRMPRRRPCSAAPSARSARGLHRGRALLAAMLDEERAARLPMRSRASQGRCRPERCAHERSRNATLRRLQTELAQLRAALRTVEAPRARRGGAACPVSRRGRAARANAAAAARHRRRLAAAPRRRGRRRARRRCGARRRRCCASSGLRSSTGRGRGAASRSRRRQRVSAAAELAGLSPSSSYSVVRVRIPLSAFARRAGHGADGTIEADLLVGEDGLARAIRFNEADALLVSVAEQ